MRCKGKRGKKKKKRHAENRKNHGTIQKAQKFEQIILEVSKYLAISKVFHKSFSNKYHVIEVRSKTYITPPKM